MAIEQRFYQAWQAIGMHPPRVAPAIKVLAIVEATTVNAVARNVLEFHRAALELQKNSPDFPRVEVSLITFDRSPSGSVARPSGRASSDNEFVRAARAAGVRIDVIPERRRFDRGVIPALREIIRQCAPDIVVTHQVKSHFLMRLSRLSQQYPWIAFHHGYTTTDYKMLVYNQLNRWTLPKADRVVTVCQAFANELVNAGVSRERVSVLHNSIRPQPATGTSEVKALKSHLGIGEERVILAVGRFSKEKAQLDLLHAFKHLREVNQISDARLVFVGDGPERERLEAVASSLSLGDSVLLPGQVRNVQPYYALADVLVNPSHSEGSPYVLLEAMSAGVPIVATSVGGVPEMVTDNETALLVPPRDPQAMSAAIARVLTDAQLAQRLSENASALGASRFAPETSARTLVKIYQKVL